MKVKTKKDRRRRIRKRCLELCIDERRSAVDRFEFSLTRFDRGRPRWVLSGWHVVILIRGSRRRGCARGRGVG